MLLTVAKGGTNVPETVMLPPWAAGAAQAQTVLC